jgi:ADP-ribose pyrophosphatase YjhB (NUDIX family)
MIVGMKYAPQDVFEQILTWAVIPTFDLVIEIEGKGFLLVKRKISPYKDQWALPGLRMYKGEEIQDSLVRIAQQEVGLRIDPNEKVLVGQYVGKFKTEHERQDLSTAYYFKLPESTEITINPEHFSSYVLTKEIPKNIGAMYKSYLKKLVKE